MNIWPSGPHRWDDDERIVERVRLLARHLRSDAPLGITPSEWCAIRRLDAFARRNDPPIPAARPGEPVTPHDMFAGRRVVLIPETWSWSWTW